MKLLLGPILHADECQGDLWRFSIHLLFGDVRDPATPPPMTIRFSSSDGVRVGDPELVETFHSRTIGYWRWPVEIRRDPAERWLDYELVPNDAHAIGALPAPFEIRRVAIPARGELPRIAFFSCNGFSDLKSGQRVPDKNKVWRQMVRRHFDTADKPPADGHGGYHLLVGGGDQIYADELWHTPLIPELQTLGSLSFEDRVKKVPSAEFAQKIEAAYIDLYRRRWSQGEVAFMMARVPGLYTWDDHDIFDGWGSFPQELLESPYYRQIYAAAEKTFRAFQLGGGRNLHPACATDHFLQHLSFETADRALDLVLLDLRSGRSLTEVMSEAQWRDLKVLLRQIGAKPAPARGRHVLVVSSIPVVYLGFGRVESLLNRAPVRAEIEDDLRDQWESRAHQGDRARLVMNLLELAAKDRVRVTILSGDVHVGARARISSERHEVSIDQLTSSAIVHPPPTAMEWLAISMVGDGGPFDVAEGVRGELLPVSGGDCFLRERNWLSIIFDEAASSEGRLWAKWFAESGPVSKQVTISAD